MEGETRCQLETKKALKSKGVKTILNMNMRRKVVTDEVIERRATRWPKFLSSFRNRKTRLIAAFTTHNKEEEEPQHGFNKGHSTQFKEDRRLKQQHREQRGQSSRILVATLPCISSHSSIIRSTSAKILPFSPSSSSSPLSTPSSSSSSSSSLDSDNRISIATNSLISTSIPTTEDASSSSLYSPAFDSMATIHKTTATTDDNQAYKLEPQDEEEEQEKMPCKKVYSLVIPAQAKAKAVCSSRKNRVLAIRRKEENEVLVVKVCSEPYSEFLNSIAEMILRNMDTLWEEAQLRHLLDSYLNLNSARHHTLIKLAFVDAITTIDTLLSSSR